MTGHGRRKTKVPDQTISDVLMAPLRPAKLTVGVALAGVTRGLLVGAVVAIAMLLNPFFYMIDGFQYGFIGAADSLLALQVGVMVMVMTNVTFGVLCYRLIAAGWRLKP